MRYTTLIVAIAATAAAVVQASRAEPENTTPAAAAANTLTAASKSSSSRGCPQGQARCGSGYTCVDILANVDHCGRCRNRCRGATRSEPGKCLDGRCYKDGYFTDFEAPTFTPGSIDAQDGWKRTGDYDHEVAAQTVVPARQFGEQSLRVSNAQTSGSFGDHTYAPLLANSVGERNASVGPFSRGALLHKFTVKFDVASAVPTEFQTGLRVDMSPDRGDGARMSLLRFYDTPNGINVTFFDYTLNKTACRTLPATTACENSGAFPEKVVGLYSRLRPFTVKMVVVIKEGRFNDEVKVYVNDRLRVRGTTWEEFFRTSAGQVAFEGVVASRIIKTVLFRTGGPAVLANDGRGFLFDNLLMTAE